MSWHYGLFTSINSREKFSFQTLIRVRFIRLHRFMLREVTHCLLSVVIVHDDVRAISQFGYFLIKKGVTFFSAAQKVRHSVRLGAKIFPTLFRLLLLIG